MDVIEPLITGFGWVIGDMLGSFGAVLALLFSYAPPFLQDFLNVNMVLIIALGILRLITG